MANTKINRTPSTSGSSTINTWSFWIKKSEITTAQNIYAAVVNAGNDFGIKFTNTDELEIRYWYSGAYQFRIITNRKFKDVSGWYNIVIIQNAGASTNTDRLQVWINGVRETSFGTTDFPTSGQGAAPINSTSAIQAIGYNGDNSSYFSGSMSHIHFIDGTAYNASAFGETDATTGEWKAKTSPSVTYGTNGFFILKDGNSVTDQSGRGNNFTVGGGTLTDLKDNPDNVFATMNPLNRTTSAITYSNGNNTISYPGAWVFSLGNIGVSSGKWYWEAKVNSGNNANSYYGICAEMVPAGNGFYNNSQNGAIMIGVGSGDTYIDGSYTSSGTSPVNNNTDILGLALDLDSGTKTLKIYKNGTQLTTNGTINLSSYYNNTHVFPCFSGNSSSASCSFNLNFGNGYFGTTAITTNSGNGYSGAEGSSKFNYTVPTGYSALSTKGLNE